VVIEPAAHAPPYLHGQRIRVVFDPDTSEVLEWSMTSTDSSAPSRHELVLATGWADEVGERP
jgi:hypothetical protein